MKNLLLFLFVNLVLIACNPENKKYAIDQKFVEDTILSLPEVREKNRIIDSLTNHIHGISLITEKQGEAQKKWKIQVGYNGDDRFETYNIFYFDSENKQITVENNISGNVESISEWRDIGKDSIYLSLGMKLLETETIDFLRIDMQDSEILKRLGKPENKTEAVKWETDGLFHQDWIYKQKGVVLDVYWEKPSDIKLFRISINKQCPFKTSRNIGIGSTREQVFEKYKKEIDTRQTNPETIIAGSVFAGMSFTFENNQVSEIFIGAAAE